LNIAKTISSLK